MGSGLATTYSEKLLPKKCLAQPTNRDRHLPCLVFLVDTKELNAKRSGFSQVDGAEVGGFLGEQEGWQGALAAQSEVLIAHVGEHA